MRTREAMKVAKGRLREKQPKLTVNQTRHLLKLSDAGSYSDAELAELLASAALKFHRFRFVDSAVRVGGN
jgi:hypothetical protein